MANLPSAFYRCDFCGSLRTVLPTGWVLSALDQKTVICCVCLVDHVKTANKFHTVPDARVDSHIPG